MLYHEHAGYDCEWWCYRRPATAYPELDRGTSSGRRPLRRSRDEVARHWHRLVLFWFVQAPFVVAIAEDNPGLGLGELTFLQLSTTYVPTVAGRSVGYVFLANQRDAGSDLTNPGISRLGRVLLGSSVRSFGGSSETSVCD
jgi:hypothetical protein